MKHPKKHINQINKYQTQRTNIKSSKGKTTNNTQGDSYKDLSIETLQARSDWQDILKVMKEKNYSPDYCTQQGSHSNMNEESKALQTRKS